jgi:CheY-like chemotaxis protein
LVELHAGTITATSAGRDQGAVFTIEFPRLPETAGLPETGSRSASSNDSPTTGAKDKTGWRILLVEDHEPTRTALGSLLTRRKYHVLSAPSVAAARTLVENNKFDLVISDLGLPDGDGFAFMAELRDKYGLRGIALSGYGTEQDVARGKNAGFVAHLTKPVRVESLEKTLAEID